MCFLAILPKIYSLLKSVKSLLFCKCHFQESVGQWYIIACPKRWSVKLLNVLQNLHCTTLMFDSLYILYAELISVHTVKLWKTWWDLMIVFSFLVWFKSEDNQKINGKCGCSTLSVNGKCGTATLELKIVQRD